MPAKHPSPIHELAQHLGDVAVAAARDGCDDDEAELATELCRAARRFCKNHVDPLRQDREARLPEELLKGLGELGLFGLTVPSEYGGAGLSLQGTARVVSELAQSDGSVATTVGLHSGLALRPLIERGSVKVRQRYLPEVAAGQRVASFAATEAEAGSDISSLRTTAVLDGERLILTGSKVFVTNGGFARLVTILARTPGLGGAKQGCSLLLVDPCQRGVTRGGEEHKLGLKGSSTITIDLDAVEVGQDHVLGEPGQGLSHFQAALVWGRTLLSAGCLGSAQDALQRAVAHVTTRKQFGRPLSRFALVRERVARACSDELAIRATLAVTSALHGQGVDVAWESTACKVICSETAFEIIDSSLQLHGGMGYIEETGIARRLRDCRVTRIFEGANDVLRLHGAAACLTWDFGPLPRLSDRVQPRLGPLAARLDEALGRPLEAVAVSVKSLGFRIVDRQLQAARVADILFDIYGLLAALAYVEGRLARGEGAERDVGRLTLLVDRTLFKLRRALPELGENADAEVEAVAKAELDSAE